MPAIGRGGQAQYTIDTKYRVDNGDQCLLRRRYPASVIQGSRGGVSKGPQGDGTSPIAMALMKDRLRWVDLEFDSDGLKIFFNFLILEGGAGF